MSYGLARSEGSALAAEGIARAEAGANPEWIAAADRALWNVASSMWEFTTDHVLNELALDEPSTRDRRALGGVMTRARREGICVPIELKYGRSTRSIMHTCPKRTWRSQIFGGPFTEEHLRSVNEDLDHLRLHTLTLEYYKTKILEDLKILEQIDVNARGQSQSEGQESPTAPD